MPALVPVDSGDSAQWQSWAGNFGWRIIAPAAVAGAPIDARIQSIERAVQQATQSGAADPSRIYLVGRGEATAAVFYAISRVPDLFAAAAALGGSPQPAIDSGLLYGANFAHVPVLWIGSAPYDRTPAEQLRSAGIALEWRSAESANIMTRLRRSPRSTRAGPMTRSMRTSQRRSPMNRPLCQTRPKSRYSQP